MLKYAARHYNDTLRLKIPFLLWLSMLYSVRHVLLIYLASRLGLELAGVTWVTFQTSTWLLLGDVPGFLVLLASGHRIPEALSFMKWVWRHGRWILGLSYFLDAALFAYDHMALWTGADKSSLMTGVVVVATDIVALGYLFKSSLVKDVFNEFPEPAPAEPSRLVSSERELVDALEADHRKALLDFVIYVPPSHQGEDLEITEDIALALQQAARHEAAGQLAEAEVIYRAVLSRSSEQALAWHGLGVLAFEAGQREHGLQLVREAARVDGRDGMILRNLCEMYRRVGQLDEAIQYGRSACKLSPQDAEARVYLGLALANAQRFQEAASAFREALQIEPNHGQCWNNLGVALQMLGDKAGAEHAYRKTLALIPGHAGAKNNLSKLGVA